MTILICRNAICVVPGRLLLHDFGHFCQCKCKSSEEWIVCALSQLLCMTNQAAIFWITHFPIHHSQSQEKAKQDHHLPNWRINQNARMLWLQLIKLAWNSCCSKQLLMLQSRTKHLPMPAHEKQLWKCTSACERSSREHSVCRPLFCHIPWNAMVKTLWETAMLNFFADFCCEFVTQSENC